MKVTGVDIQIAYGETIDNEVIIEGATFTGDDRALFVIRDANGVPIINRAYVLTKSDEIAGAYTFWLDIQHSVSELLLPVNYYEWGLSIYKNADLAPNKTPINGTVKAPIATGRFNVIKNIAREEGLV